MKKPERLIVVTGPTASGKSALAYNLASQINGAIINADSVQIFKQANIGSAKPSTLEMARLPHLLFSELSPIQKIDAAKFAKLADAAIASALKMRLIPIIAGGTGLYLKSLLHGLMDLPAGRDRSNTQITGEAADIEVLYQRLKTIDPKTAQRISPTDEVRIRRAIEIHDQTATTASELRDNHSFKDLRFSAYVIVCVPDREVLYETINKRTLTMLNRGLLHEARDLMLCYGPNAQLFKAIGYKESLEVLRGDLGLGEFVEEVAKNTRRLAKRQFTWWRNEPTKLGWTTDHHAVHSVDSLLNRLSTFLAAEGELAEDRIYVRFFDPHGLRL